MDTGGLVPDDLIVAMVLSETQSNKCEHLLLDGFPRTLGQAETLGKNMTVDLVLNLAVPTEEIVQRAAGRWMHPESGRTYAYDYNPPKEEGKDDVTGEPLVQRNDDKPEVVRQRLKGYDDVTKPLLTYYQTQNLMHEFDGSDHPDLVEKGRRSDAIYLSVKPLVDSKLK